MATGAESGKTTSRPIPEASYRGAPTSNAAGAASPPSKRELASWWKKFSRRNERDEEKALATPGIFGVPLPESIRYANVAISLTNEQGESFIYGYVPIVVAKCGVFLKEKATDVEGIFRLSGSAKRIKDLQTIFNSPDRYGKGLDWTGYTVHDAANILRRYLNQLPEPIVPLESYERFRDPLRSYQSRFDHSPEGLPPDFSAEEHATAVTAYQQLIIQLPALNRQLLLYILDLLAVFASKSDLNRMTAANLAAIFQPGIISHPMHDMAPQEYRLSQDVLIFLIENQDNFLIGMNGTAVDEVTQKHVEGGGAVIKSSKTTNLGRSASNASAGADSLRKFGIRRNVSVSSRDRTSPNVSAPGTPTATGTGSLGRSNTVPSKRSPAIGQQRFQRESPSQSSTTAVTPTAEIAQPLDAQVQENVTPAVMASEPVPDAATIILQDVPSVKHSVTAPPGEPGPIITSPQQTGEKKSVSRERKISNLFARSPIFGPSPVQINQGERQPRKLQKRQKLPGSMNISAQSSAASLQHDEGFHTPLVSPNLRSATQPDPLATAIGNHAMTPVSEDAVNHKLATPPSVRDRQGSQLSKPARSPTTSLHSGASATDPSDFDALDDATAKADREEKRRRWRFSSGAKKRDDSPLAPPPPIGQMSGARASNSSIGSSRPRQSFTVDSHVSQQAATDSSSTGQPSVLGHSSRDSHETPKDSSVEEKKGLFGKWKAKMQQSREERKEKEAERERAKSPQRLTGDNASSRNSLSALAHEHFSTRGKSFDKSREEILSPVNEQPQDEQQSVLNNGGGREPEVVAVQSPIVEEEKAPKVTLSPSTTVTADALVISGPAPVEADAQTLTGDPKTDATTNDVNAVQQSHGNGAAGQLPGLEDQSNTKTPVV